MTPIPREEIEKACKWASEVVYMYKLNVSVMDIPEDDFRKIKYCWSVGDYVLCPDKLLQGKEPPKISGATLLGVITCRENQGW